MDMELVQELAEYAREWAEAYDASRNISSGDLCGMCAIASAFLFRELKRAGVKAELAYSDFHFFVLVNGQWIIDITATQFDLPGIENFKPIEIRRLNEIKKDYWFWQPTHTLTSLNQMYIYQQYLRWSKEQRASNFKINAAVLN